MKLEISRRELLLGFQAAKLPNAPGVLFDPKPDGLEIRVSNGLITTSQYIHDVPIVKPEQLLVPAVIVDLVRALKDDRLILETTATGLMVRASDKSYRFPKLDPDLFIGIEEPNEEMSLKMDMDDLKRGVDAVGFAISDTEGRYALNGVLLDARDPGMVKLVGSDGRRLAVYRFALPDSQNGEPMVIVPIDAFKSLLKTKSSEDDLTEVSITLGQGRILLAYNNTKVVSQLIEGEYPDYNSVFPENLNIECSAPLEPFRESLRRLSLVSEKDVPIITMLFKENALQVLAETGGGEKGGEENIPLSALNGTIEMKFNLNYILDFLKVAGYDKVEIKMQDKTTAAIFSAGPDFKYILMGIVR